MGWWKKEEEAIVPHEDTSLAEVAEVVTALAPAIKAAGEATGRYLQYKTEVRMAEEMRAASARELDSFDRRERNTSIERCRYNDNLAEVVKELVRNGHPEEAREILNDMRHPPSSSPMPPMPDFFGFDIRNPVREDDYIDAEAWVREDPSDDFGRGGP